MQRCSFFITILKASQIASLAIAAFTLPQSSPAQTQSQPSNVRGTVRDSQGKSVAGATVTIEASQHASTVKGVTDEKGAYGLSLPAGTYAVEATKPGYANDKAVPFTLGPNETKTINLTILALQGGPTFYDQPQFTVSGVTDTTSLGGHGSDMVVRTRDALAKETAGLTKSATSVPAASLELTERSLRDEADHEPGNFEANRRMGHFLLENGRAAEALPYLENAEKLKPNDYDIQLAVAVANANTANLERSKQEAQSLLQGHDTAEVHHLLADVDEKLGDPLEAVRHYQRAAELSSSEPYLFDWGTELLLHHAPEPALDVFARGHKLFPQSARMLIGMGASSFAVGNYDQAVESVDQASDLAPADSAPYLFLGKMDRITSISSAALAERLRRFAQLHPENAEANYYYAVALWKRRKGSPDQKLHVQVESLLKNAIRLDPKFAAAFRQLGTLYSDERDFQKAIVEYEQAIQCDPQEPEAHYRLAQAYRQVDQPEKAKTETDIYERLAKESATRAEGDRREMRQFVYTLRDPQTTPTH
jgi:tetratricopeptide (TPR) repeat protein